MAHDVFISYASGDKSIADAACALLESRSIRCWIAPRDVLPGKPYAESIVDAIKSSRTVVLVFSEGANASSQVLREVERAVNAGIPVIPFRIEDVTPSKSMEYFISSSHWLDALTEPVEHHLHRLADVVVRLLSDGQVAPSKAAQKLASPYALLYELGYSIPAFIDGSRKAPEAAQQLVISVSGLFTQLRLAQPEGWRHWGSDEDLEWALLSSYGAMKALVSPMGDRELGHFHLGWFMWLHGRMNPQPGASGISLLKTVLAVCGLPEAIENKVLHFFEELNVDSDWQERSNEDWQARSLSLVALISEVQQHLRGISGLTTG